MSDGFEGMDQLIDDLGKLDQFTQEEVLAEMFDIAAEMAADWKAGVRVRSGKHRRSIHVGSKPELTPDFAPGDDRGYKDLGGLDISGSSIAITVGTNVPHGYWEEYGGPTNAANPAGRRAFERAKDEMAERLLEAKDRAAKKANL